MSKTGGWATALELAGGIGDLGLGADGQDDLFEADAPLPLSPAVVGQSGPRGGRPKGARNRSTEEMRAFLLAKYRSPLVGLLEVAARPAEALARELKLWARAPDGEIIRDGAGDPVLAPDAVMRAFDRQINALTAALPYLEKKQPVAIETNGKVAGVIVIGDLVGLAESGDGMITIVPMKPEQKQQVIDADIVQSDAQQSDEWGKANDHNGEANTGT